MVVVVQVSVFLSPDNGLKGLRFKIVQRAFIGGLVYTLNLHKRDGNGWQEAATTHTSPLSNKQLNIH